MNSYKGNFFLKLLKVMIVDYPINLYNQNFEISHSFISNNAESQELNIVSLKITNLYMIIDCSDIIRFEPTSYQSYIIISTIQFFLISRYSVSLFAKC